MVIVPYQTERIVLHGVRDVASLAEELPDPYARAHGWELPQTFSFRSLEEGLPGLDP